MLIDTTQEIEELQNKLWLERSPQERAEFQSSMFAAGREVIIASISPKLTGQSLKREVFFRTYGEHLPDDFFDRKYQ